MAGPSISIIGAGNVAWHLAPALDNSGYRVNEVYSRSRGGAEDLVSKLYEAEINESLDFSASTSGIFLLCIPDDAIEEVTNEITIPQGAILVHTSGSRSLDVLGDVPGVNIGVFYPLQTFTKGKKMDLQEVPIFIETEQKEVEHTLMNMAGAISKKVFSVTSEKRLALHVAAVFASNFTNHMLAIANSIMIENKLDYDWLKPLIAEALNKSLAIGPDKAQTGPARRGDLQILDKHVKWLSKEESLQEIYRVISQHILDKYQT